ncbi:MAG: hypothetical protein GY854_05955 [Deltaproteobacteria bacterium]|nr:hypothetical protein [Deltaproteobacteria bacterium]
MDTIKYEMDGRNFIDGKLADSNTEAENDVFNFICVALRQKQLCNDLKAAMSWASKIPMDMNLDGRRAFLARTRGGIARAVEEFADNQQLLGRLMPEVTRYREMLNQHDVDSPKENLAKRLGPLISQELHDDSNEADLEELDEMDIEEVDEADLEEVDGPDFAGLDLDDDSGPDLTELFKEDEESKQQCPTKEESWDSGSMADSEESRVSRLSNLEQLLDHEAAPPLGMDLENVTDKDSGDMNGAFLTHMQEEKEKAEEAQSDE